MGAKEMSAVMDNLMYDGSGKPSTCDAESPLSHLSELAEGQPVNKSTLTQSTTESIAACKTCGKTATHTFKGNPYCEWHAALIGDQRPRNVWQIEKIVDPLAQQRYEARKAEIIAQRRDGSRG